MALALTAVSSRIERITMLESVDLRGYENEPMYRAMGIDRDPADPEAATLIAAACGSFRDQVAVMAHALALDLDEIRFHADFAVADMDTDFGFMTVGAGRVAAIRGTIAGWAGGRPRIECRSVWKLGERTTPDWPVEHGYADRYRGHAVVPNPHRARRAVERGHQHGVTARQRHPRRLRGTAGHRQLRRTPSYPCHARSPLSHLFPATRCRPGCDPADTSRMVDTEKPLALGSARDPLWTSVLLQRKTGFELAIRTSRSGKSLEVPFPPLSFKPVNRVRRCSRALYYRLFESPLSWSKSRRSPSLLVARSQSWRVERGWQR